MEGHSVQATMAGADAHLRCGACNAATRTSGFDGMNAFLASHKSCQATVPVAA